MQVGQPRLQLAHLRPRHMLRDCSGPVLCLWSPGGHEDSTPAHVRNRLLVVHARSSYGRLVRPRGHERPGATLR
eukprot:9103421-Alexandrium_andersonii.AAC.1